MELMIALAIGAILITVVAPNVNHIVQQNQIVAQTNQSSSLLQFARANAVNEQFATTLCPTADFQTCTNNWQQALMVFSDENNDNVRNDNEPLLASTERASATTLISGPAQPFRFNPDGSSNIAASLVMCHQNGDETKARGLYIALNGRVKTSQDSNNDGVYEDLDGNAIECP